MFSTDHLFGSFEFNTDLTQDPQTKEWIASALGHQVKHPQQDQALNDLNALIHEKMMRGEIVPNGGS